MKYEPHHLAPQYTGRIEKLEKLISLCKQFGARNARVAYNMMFNYMELSGHKTCSQLAKYTSQKENWIAFKNWLMYGPQLPHPKHKTKTS